jgi:hypothetical protein
MIYYLRHLFQQAGHGIVRIAGSFRKVIFAVVLFLGIMNSPKGLVALLGHCRKSVTAISIICTSYSFYINNSIRVADIYFCSIA